MLLSVGSKQVYRSKKEKSNQSIRWNASRIGFFLCAFFFLQVLCFFFFLLVGDDGKRLSGIRLSLFSFDT